MGKENWRELDKDKLKKELEKNRDIIVQYMPIVTDGYKKILIELTKGLVDYAEIKKKMEENDNA